MPIPCFFFPRWYHKLSNNPIRGIASIKTSKNVWIHFFFLSDFARNKETLYFRENQITWFVKVGIQAYGKCALRLKL